MNILIINHYAGSPKHGMTYRPFYLAKKWVDFGHNVTIIGANFSHLRTHQPKIDGHLTEEYIEGIRYIWIKTPPYNSSGIKRVVNILVFVLKLSYYFKKIAQIVKPDMVISSSTYPLDIYPAYLIAKKNKSKLIFELHDMWPLSPMIIGGYSKWHPFICLTQMAENFACKNVNGYISMLANTEKYLIQHGLSSGKFAHVPNGFIMEEWQNNLEKIPFEHSTLIDQLKQQNKIIIGYVGGHGPSNALDVFVDAANKINNNKFSFVLVGFGLKKNDLIQKANDLNLDNIFFLPNVNKKCIPNLLIKFDVLFAGGVSSVLHSYGTSYNKLAEYMLAEKPIIFSVDEPNSLVEKVGCGFQIPAENTIELIKTILAISELSDYERREMGAKGKKYAFDELEYTKLAKKFLDSVDKF